MRALVQRVVSASVTVDNKLISEIGSGLLVFLGIKADDTQSDRDYLIKKILNLRIFSDQEDKMNKSIVDISGEMLLVSQFTLYGDCAKGNRPSFAKAMKPEQAKQCYDDFVQTLKQQYHAVKEGVFAAHMQVALVNDGPVTILIESKK